MKLSNFRPKLITGKSVYDYVIYADIDVTTTKRKFIFFKEETTKTIEVFKKNREFYFKKSETGEYIHGLGKLVSSFEAKNRCDIWDYANLNLRQDNKKEKGL